MKAVCFSFDRFTTLLLNKNVLETLNIYLFSSITSSHCRPEQNVSELQQSGSETNRPEVALLLVAPAPRPWGRLGGPHGQPWHGGKVARCCAMRGPLGVAVSRVTVVDGTGQRVQLLQRHPKSHPHVGGDQVPAGHAEMTKILTQKWPNLIFVMCLLHKHHNPWKYSHIIPRQLLVKEHTLN